MALTFQDTFTDTNGVKVGGNPASGHVANLGAVGAYAGNSNGPPASALINANLVRCSVGDPHNDFHRTAIAKMTTPLTAVEYRFDVKPIQTIVGAIMELFFRYNTNVTPIGLATAAEYFSIYLIKSALPDVWQVYGSYGPWISGNPATPLPGASTLSGPGFSSLLGTANMTDGGAGLRFGATRFGGTNRYDIWREPFGGGVRTFIGSFGFPNYAFDGFHNGIGIGFNGPGGVTTISDMDNLEAADSTVGGGAPPAVGFRDTFTDPNGTLLSAHTPDIPGSGTYVQAAEIPHDVQSNRGRIVTLDAVARFSMFNTDILSGESDGEAFWDFERVGAAGGGRRTVLAVRKNPANSEHLGLAVVYNASGTMQIRAVRKSAGGTPVEDVLIVGLAFGAGAQFRFGMTIAGASAEFWTEPYGGGTRTIRGTHIFGVSHKDSSHRRIAIETISGGFGGNEVLAFIDNLNGPGTSQIIPAGIASAEAFGSLQATINPFSTTCHGVTKAAIPTFTEIECTPPV